MGLSLWVLAACLAVVTWMVLVDKDLPRHRRATAPLVGSVVDALLIVVLAVIGSAGFTLLSQQGGH